MSTPRPLALRLETFWQPPSDGKELAYVLRLKNLAGEPVSDFSLCFTGPGRVDPEGRIEGATIARRLSNFTELRPPSGFVLGAGETWAISVHALSWAFRHWTDGATSAYLVLADGSTVSLAVEPTRTANGNAPPKRGAELYPVPAVAPVQLSIIPWPNHVAVAIDTR